MWFYMRWSFEQTLRMSRFWATVGTGGRLWKIRIKKKKRMKFPRKVKKKQ